MMHRIWQSVVLLSLALAGAPAAHALESEPIKTPRAQVRLVSEVEAVEPGKPFRLGVSFKLAKGWHIYWVNPGDAGEPPQLDLTLPRGATSSPISWPAPLRVPEGPVMTYSYIGDVLLPFTVTSPRGVTAFPVEARLRWLICEKICVPEEGTLRLDLPVGAATPSPQAPLFADADARIARPSPYVATISRDGVLSLTGETISPQTLKDASFFPDHWGAIDDAAPQTFTVAHGEATLALKPASTFDPSKPLTGVLAVEDDSGVETYLAIAALPEGVASVAIAQGRDGPAVAPAADAPATHPAPDTSFLATLMLAFLGGLILNLMPCVFPILAVKAVGIAKLSGRERAMVRSQAAFYTLGILVAFAGIGLVMLALRAAGSVNGWGFQFQSPAFVAAMAWLLFAVGLNLSGVFEVGGGFMGAGASLASRGGQVGSFFTGLLAVLVATPCTAPFMGAAVAAALSASPSAAIAIFLAMGLGLAVPSLLLALVPGLAGWLPRPGPWMRVLRQCLALPMYAAALWLVWVISQQTASDGVFLTLSGGALIGLAALAFGLTQGQDGRVRLLGRTAAAVAGLALFVILSDIMQTPPPESGTALAFDGAKPFSATRLAELRAQGRPVFVNMTAAWCVTCLVNERIALSGNAVKQAFIDHNVAYLKGDWTLADPEISEFLRQHGRDGVPLYLLFPPNGRAPIVLPQILTANTVIDELDHLGS
jgi:thiol:disulfide interchange protein/DsbC/DsbD-like thiol-disulfide interchange protein